MFDSIVDTIKKVIMLTIMRTRIIMNIYQTNLMKFQDVEELKV